MKIAVCVKAVPDAATGRRLDPSSKRLDRSGELALSDYDTQPVEEALNDFDLVRWSDHRFGPDNVIAALLADQYATHPEYDPDWRFFLGLE